MQVNLACPLGIHQKRQNNKIQSTKKSSWRSLSLCHGDDDADDQFEFE